MDIFSGTLTLDDGARVPIDLGLDEENVTLRTDGREIGTWPLKYCRVARSGRGAVILSLDGEKAVFEPDDVPRFSTAAAQRFRASSLADRISVIRDVELPPATGERATGREGSSRAEKPVKMTRRRWAGIGLVAVSGLLVSLVAAYWLAEDDPPEFAGTTITVAPTVAVVPPLFDQTLEEFTHEWNLAATAFDVPIQIRTELTPGQFESQLSPYLTLQGRTDPDGTIGSLVLVIDPRGDTGDDQVALAALGVAMAVANPELESDERGDVLAGMGLSVRDLELAGVDGEAQVGENAYSLAYFAEFNALLLSISPA